MLEIYFKSLNIRINVNILLFFIRGCKYQVPDTSYSKILVLNVPYAFFYINPNISKHA